MNELALKNLCEYIKIPSVHPNINYSQCVEFLVNLAKDIGLPSKVINVKPNKPIVLITWTGRNPELPSILFNSHMDVVPAQEDKWTHKPFAAEIHKGRIYGRGTQDIKGVGIMYLEAIRRLKLQGETYSRTILVSFVPDEEIGGKEGMNLFIKSKEFQELNIGAAFDEGAPSETKGFNVFYGEKCCWIFKIKCKGTSGHGSLLLESTPGEKISYILNKIYEFRKTQRELLNEDLLSNADVVTSVNCTKIEGGVQNNVVPCELSLTLDCRIPHHTSSRSLEEFENMLEKWCEEAEGGGCEIDFKQKDAKSPITNLDNSNVYWLAFKEAIEGELKLKLKPKICPGTTDSRYLRSVGIQTFSFTPLDNTPILLHGNDEYMELEQFWRGIEIYCAVMKAVANV